MNVEVVVLNCRKCKQCLTSSVSKVSSLQDCPFSLSLSFLNVYVHGHGHGHGLGHVFGEYFFQIFQSIFPSFWSIFPNFREYFPNFLSSFPIFEYFSGFSKYFSGFSEHFSEFRVFFRVLPEKAGILDPRIPFFSDYSLGIIFLRGNWSLFRIHCHYRWASVSQNQIHQEILACQDFHVFSPDNPSPLLNPRRH